MELHKLKDKIDNESNKEEIENLNKEFKDKYNELKRLCGKNALTIDID